jgi:hypothetical protein
VCTTQINLISGIIIFRTSPYDYEHLIQEWAKVVPECRVPTKQELRGASHGVYLKTPVCSMPVYMTYLHNEILSLGGKIIQKEISSILRFFVFFIFQTLNRFFQRQILS